MVMLSASESSGGNFQPVSAGTHAARCVQVIDLGTQYSEYYKNWKRKILLGWEIPEEKDDDGTPRLIWKRYTASLHENAVLRQHLANWRGRDFTPEELDGFNLSSVLRAPCLITVSHRKDGNKTYADVSSVAAIMKGMQVPEPVAEVVDFDFEQWDQNVFESFSENLQATIMKSQERSEAPRQEPAFHEPHFDSDAAPDSVPGDDSDVPF